VISSLHGRLLEKHPAEAIIEVAGVGFRCRISLATYSALPEEDETVALLTELIIRDDGADLYGFAEEAERTLFGLLTAVSGVGPRMAQGILSGLSVEEFARALAAEDLVTLTGIKGVGRKTAERLVLELKEKLPHLAEVAGEAVPLAEEQGEEAAAWQEEAVLALRSLGYGTGEAEVAVRRAVEQMEGEPTVEALVKRALTLAR